MLESCLKIFVHETPESMVGVWWAPHGARRGGWATSQKAQRRATGLELRTGAWRPLQGLWCCSPEPPVEM